MARIPMTSGFEIVPEGWDVFRVLEANYKEEFGKMEIVLINAKGLKHTEKFNLKKQTGDWNEKALAAFSYFAKVCLDDFTREDIDESELVGHYIKAEVTHDKVESNKGDGKMYTFAHLGTKEVAHNFEVAPTAKTVETMKLYNLDETSRETKGIDLNSLLEDDDLPF